MNTKIPLSSVAASTDGTVVAEAGLLSTVVPNKDEKNFTGNFDSAAGILTLTIPELGTIQLSGFPVVTDLGKGEPGDPGASGRAGVDGTIGRDGDQGPAGCMGPSGTRGDPGRDGPRGVQGPEGPRGPAGPKGDPGKDGALQVYMQVEDPATTGQNVQAGAIWIIP
jgi:hypothetical protein